jgi:hypothetical protein
MKLETKFGNRIDSDSGYDNLKLAQDLVTISEKHYAKQLLIPVVVRQSKQLKPKPQICYKSNKLCKYDCSGLCKESC